MSIEKHIPEVADKSVKAIFWLVFLLGASLVVMAVYFRVKTLIGLHEFFALLYTGVVTITLSILLYVFAYSMEWARNRILLQMIVDDLKKDRLLPVSLPHPWLKEPSQPKTPVLDQK